MSEIVDIIKIVGLYIYGLVLPFLVILVVAFVFLIISNPIEFIKCFRDDKDKKEGK